MELNNNIQTSSVIYQKIANEKSQLQSVDKNDKSTKLTDNFKQNCRLTEISKTVRIITSS